MPEAVGPTAELQDVGEIYSVPTELSEIRASRSEMKIGPQVGLSW